MKIGADTGFLIALIQDHPKALDYWRQILRGDSFLVLSVLSANELLTYCYRKGSGDLAKQIIDRLKSLTTVSIEPVTLEMAEKGAGFRHGLGMSTADAIILATFVLIGCDLILTKDNDFQRAKEQGILPVEWLN
jgi:predicted nucleic acid-binding protein